MVETLSVGAIWFYAAIIVTALAIFIALAALWQENEKTERISTLLIGLASILITIGLIFRGVSLGRFPLSGLYEFSLAFLVIMAIAFFILRRRIPSRTLTLVVALALFLGTALSLSVPHNNEPLMPALKSPWLSAHVLTAIIAYGAFAIAAILGAIYLLEQKKAEPERLALLDELAHKAVVIGFIFQTFLLVTGAVWAEEVWGNWWSWDPKETWALITWFVYAIYLHGYRSRGWRGKKAAIFTLIGMLVVVFTLFGVSLLLPGMHSYF